MHRHSKHLPTNSSAFATVSQPSRTNSPERTTAYVTLRPNFEEATPKTRISKHDSRTQSNHRHPSKHGWSAYEKKLNANKDRVGELQARELEKGAHLLEDHVDNGEINVVDDRLERICKDDGESYFRLPEVMIHSTVVVMSPLVWGSASLQQLAKMDEDMLRATTSSLPSRLAAKLWKARTDPAVGDNPWKNGSKSVREYVTAGDLKHWIRRQEKGISDDYAKKLVSRTIDALLDLSKQAGSQKRTQRKNGLEYTERRVLLMDDVDIPGEMAGSGDT